MSQLTRVLLRNFIIIFIVIFPRHLLGQFWFVILQATLNLLCSQHPTPHHYPNQTVYLSFVELAFDALVWPLLGASQAASPVDCGLLFQLIRFAFTVNFQILLCLDQQTLGFEMKQSWRHSPTSTYVHRPVAVTRNGCLGETLIHLSWLGLELRLTRKSCLLARSYRRRKKHRCEIYLLHSARGLCFDRSPIEPFWWIHSSAGSSL